MAKVLYGLAIFCLGIGLLDVTTKPPGSRGANEGVLLLLFAVVFTIAGFVAKRMTTKVCAKCQSRVPKAASKCAHCASDLPLY